MVEWISVHVCLEDDMQWLYHECVHVRSLACVFLHVYVQKPYCSYLIPYITQTNAGAFIYFYNLCKKPAGLIYVN